MVLASFSPDEIAFGRKGFRPWCETGRQSEPLLEMALLWFHSLQEKPTWESELIALVCCGRGERRVISFWWMEQLLFWWKVELVFGSQRAKNGAEAPIENPYKEQHWQLLMSVRARLVFQQTKEREEMGEAEREEDEGSKFSFPSSLAKCWPKTRLLENFITQLQIQI